MADLARARGGLNVFVARDGSRAGAFEQALTFFAPEMEVLRLPAWDCLPYDRVSPSAAVAAERMATMTRLARGGWDKKPVLLLTQAAAVLQRLPPKESVLAAGYSAQVGARVEMADLERYFEYLRSYYGIPKDKAVFPPKLTSQPNDKATESEEEVAA